MSHTSSKHRKRKLRIAGIIILALVIIISFFVSRKANHHDEDLINEVPVQEISAHIKGNESAELHLIEYSDFQCPACRSTEPVLAQLQEEYGDSFFLEYRHFPLRQIHPNAQLAAQAAEAAGMQGMFWEMHDHLFEHQDQWAKSLNPKRYFSDYAEELGLHAERFAYDLESDAVKDRVNKDADEAMAYELPGTPSFVFNGEQISLEDFVNVYLLKEEVQ